MAITRFLAWIQLNSRYDRSKIEADIGHATKVAEAVKATYPEAEAVFVNREAVIYGLVASATANDVRRKLRPQGPPQLQMHREGPPQAQMRSQGPGHPQAQMQPQGVPPPQGRPQREARGQDGSVDDRPGRTPAPIAQGRLARQHPVAGPQPLQIPPTTQRLFAVQLIIVDRGTGMKRILILSLLSALLGGCVIVPAGYGYRGDGYYRGYYHGDGYYRRDGYRGYGYRDQGG